MAYQIFHLPKEAPVIGAGWKAQFFLTGTTTETDIYTTSALSTTHTNPVVANAAGTMAVIYLDPSVVYKVSIFDENDVLQYTADPCNDALSVSGENVIHDTTVNETSAGVTPADKSIPDQPIIDLRRYGLSEAASGATNRAAIEAARDVAKVIGGAILQAPAGTFTIDATVTIDGNDIIIRGVGAGTIWQFNPASADVLFDFTQGAGISYRCGIADCLFYSSNSTTKTAVRVQDCKKFLAVGLAIGQTGWPGSGSIGLHILGRERLLLRDSELLCARPVVVDINPNYATIHTDFFAFEDLILGSTETTGTAVEILDGVDIGNFAFKRIAFVLGKWAVKWVDTSSSINSYAITFDDCRVEQAADATGYAFEFTTSATAIQNISWKNCYLWNGSNGIKLAGARCITIADTNFSSVAGRVALDIAFVSQTELVLRNTFIVNTETVTLTNAVLVGAAPLRAADEIPRNALYRYNEAAIISQQPALGYNNVKNWSWQGTLADSTSMNLPVLRATHYAAIVKVAAYSATGPIHCGGSAIWTRDGSMTKIGGTTNFVTAAAGTELRCLDGGSGVNLINVLGQDVTLVVDVEYV